MTPKLRPEQTGIHYDDLTVLKGIKENRQQWLREALRVRTYGDLAALSVDDILAQLPQGQIISRQQIETWIRQAKHLSSAEKPAAQLPKREQGWHPFASFVIEFQEREDQSEEKRTKVHYMEADKTSMWSGIETEALSDWITAQLNPKQETGFSERLQQILAKTQSIQAQSTVPTTRIHQKSTEAAKPDDKEFSEKLQEAMAKSQRLAAHRK